MHVPNAKVTHTHTHKAIPQAVALSIDAVLKQHRNKVTVHVSGAERQAAELSITVVLKYTHTHGLSHLLPRYPRAAL